MHRQCQGAASEAQLRRGVPEAGPRLPRHRGVPEGDAQTKRLGRTALRRSEGLARAAPVSVAGAGEGQRRGVADRGGTESEALAELAGVGAPPVSEWSRWRRPPGTPAPAGSAALTTAHRLDRFGRPHSTASGLPFFNRQVWLPALLQMAAFWVSVNVPRRDE